MVFKEKERVLAAGEHRVVLRIQLSGLLAALGRNPHRIVLVQAIRQLKEPLQVPLAFDSPDRHAGFPLDEVSVGKGITTLSSGGRRPANPLAGAAHGADSVPVLDHLRSWVRLCQTRQARRNACPAANSSI